MPDFALKGKKKKTTFYHLNEGNKYATDRYVVIIGSYHRISCRRVILIRFSKQDESTQIETQTR
jgi:hypothetical protein